MSTFILNAQDINHKWSVSLGVNAVDFRTSAGGGKNWTDNHFSQLFLINQNWNTFPSLSASVSKYVGYNISVKLGGSVNKIDRYPVYNPTTSEIKVINPGNLSYYEINTTGSYSFMNLIQSKKIEPIFNFGVGYTTLGKQNYGTIDSGLGLNYWFMKQFGVSLSGAYKWSTFSNTSKNRIRNPLTVLYSMVGCFKLQIWR